MQVCTIGIEAATPWVKPLVGSIRGIGALAWKDPKTVAARQCPTRDFSASWRDGGVAKVTEGFSAVIRMTGQLRENAYLRSADANSRSGGMS